MNEARGIPLESSASRSTNAISRFLWACAGSDADVLAQCPQEQAIHSSLGASVLLTAIAASMAGAYAFWTVFQNQSIAAFFGLFWGAWVFNIDRLLICTLQKSVSPAMYAVSILVRVSIAIIIATVIAFPIELRIFSTEISNFIERNQTESEQDDWKRDTTLQRNELNSQRENIDENIRRIQTTIDSLQRQINSLRSERSDVQKFVRNEQRELSNEQSELLEAEEQMECQLTGWDSKGGRCIPSGPGPIYEQLKAKVAFKEGEVSKLNGIISTLQTREASIQDSIISLEQRSSMLEAQKGDLEDENERVTRDYNLLIAEQPRRAKQSRVSADEPHSLLTSYKALSELQRDDPSVQWMVTLIWLIFLLVEVSPILAKAMQGDSRYSEIIRNHGGVKGQFR